MTVKNNSLSDRLNEFKNNKNNLEKQLLEVSKEPPIVSFLNSLISISIFTIKSLVYGFSSKIIFNTFWNFWQVICIGLCISFLLTYIHRIIHPDNY